MLQSRRLRSNPINFLHLHGDDSVSPIPSRFCHPFSIRISLVLLHQITMFVQTTTTLPTPPTTTILNTAFGAHDSTPSVQKTHGPSATNDANSESIQPVKHEIPHATILLGLGIGLVIGVLMLAGIAGLHLWRRRRNTPIKADIDIECKDKTISSCNTVNQHDTEWSIESAEKVLITKNMRAQSVLTRSSSKRSNASSESDIAPAGGPDQARKMALTSHPMTPSYAAFTAKGLS
jgi:hypothetical protein